jgi:hypothetical protein
MGAVSQAAIISAEIDRRAGRIAIVIINNPARHLSSLDCACVLRLPIRDRGLLLNPLMRACYVIVVVDELTQASP